MRKASWLLFMLLCFNIKLLFHLNVMDLMYLKHLGSIILKKKKINLVFISTMYKDIIYICFGLMVKLMRLI